MISSEKQAKGPVFTIVISEKGGAERREVFDRTELSVGRVQGNDLMLPKGNVSKRHARLLYRDGRFIVTDLNSTNGTYVNRRRISQATIVREGDRIYIGDFVLRVEASEGAADSAPLEGAASGSVPSRQGPTSSQADASRPDILVGQLEAGEESGSSYPKVPGPPRVPSGARASADSAPSDSDPSTRIPQAMSEPSRPSLDVGPSVADDRLTHEAAQYRVALVAVVDRVRGAIDQAALEGRLDDALIARIERAIAEQSAALRSEGLVGSTIPNEALSRDARAELVELGPLGPLLDDADVTEIAVPRFDHVLAHRGGRSAPVEPSFSSEATLRLALGRLCRAADAPLSSAETEIERRLPNGVRVSALVGLAGALVVLKKPRRAVASFEELVRRGTISRAIATFLQQCVAARVNVLVVGPRDAAVPAVVSALAGAAGDARVIAVQDLDELVATAAATRLSYCSEPEQAARAVHLAARFSDARLVVDLCAPELTLATLDAIGEGADGVTAALRAPNLRRALARLPAELSAGRPSMNLTAAREWIAGAFEIGLEVSRLRDGRHRVVRVAEISSGPDELHAQDIFSFVIERTAAGGSVEGAFVPSGTVPRVVEDMTARGIVVETSLFTRPPSR